MPALNFQKQFAPLVESGEKRQTIRAYRKDGRDPKVGDRLYLYTGMRTKQCRKLGEAVCTASRGMFIQRNGLTSDDPNIPADLDTFAASDGFKSFTAMRDWFHKTHGLPFNGVLIRWGEIESPQRGGERDD